MILLLASTLTGIGAGNYTERSRSIPRASSAPKRNDVLKISRISTDNASQSKYLNLQYKLSLNNSWIIMLESMFSL